MAQTSWPFENIDTTETQFSQWARNIGEGVIKGIANELEPFADSTGMVVKVRTGQALVRGHYYNNSAVANLTIPTADLTDPRIDAIVLRLDPVANTILLTIIEGTPDASPVPPALTITDGDVYEQLIATVAVTPATANIAPEDVTDARTIFVSDITGAATSIVNDDLTTNRALISNAQGKVAVSAVNSTELGQVAGVTSPIQTQLNGKQATITGGATTITTSNLTTNRAVISDGSGKVAVSPTTAAELGHVSGVTSAIQTQLNGKVNTVNGTVTTAATGSTVVRNITLSTADPSGGTDGQVWLKYT
jgi:fructose-specific component phosphotransferase system IIB-like protein